MLKLKISSSCYICRIKKERGASSATEIAWRAACIVYDDTLSKTVLIFIEIVITLEVENIAHLSTHIAAHLDA